MSGQMSPQGSLRMGNLTLDSYVPLGIVTVRPCENQPLPDSDVWTELSPYDYRPAAYKLISEDNRTSQPTSDEMFSLLNTRWIRIFHGRDRSQDLTCLRLYILPEDVARRDVPRDLPRTRSALAKLLAWPIDTSTEAWNGYDNAAGLPRGSLTQSCFQQGSCSGDESLFYIFNTIASPSPDVSVLPDAWTYDAAKAIMSGHESRIGVKTSLYPYQRRSVVTMIQRETAPQPSLDPRLEQFTGPTGQQFFYDRVTSQVYLHSAIYEEIRGGILAETMGYGKTLIVLGLVAATKDQMPKTPVEHVETRPFTNKFGARSLISMAADSAIKNGLPWRQYFRDMANSGMHYETCRKVLEMPPYYEMISVPFGIATPRASRQERPTMKIILCKTTLVVVPSNLFDQWRTEIQKHLLPGTLDVLEIKADGPSLGTPEELAQYDVILIDKKRFADEMGHRAKPQVAGGPAPAWPLSKMHFLRLVVDEGHTFASTGTSNTSMSYITSLRVERRWIVSGTPSHGLVGVEVDLAATVTDKAQASGSDTSANAPAMAQAEALKIRKQQRVDDIKDLAKLGRIVTELLRAQPWCNTLHSGDAASWSQYTRLAGNGFYCTSSVKMILQTLIVRHQIGDVEAELPTLHNKAVYLEPTMYDKISLDLFTFVMMNNAITSERKDQDYLLHEKNRKYYGELTKNLRRAPFYWSGFPPLEIRKGLEVAQKYGADHPELGGEDRHALDKALQIIPRILDDKVWVALSASQEIAFSVQDLPQAISSPLGLDDRSISLIDSYERLKWDAEPLSTTTASRLLAAQKWCKDNASLNDPLRAFGDHEVNKIANTGEHSDQVLSSSAEKNTQGKDKPKGVPMLNEAQLSDKQFAKHKSLGSIPTRKGKKRNLSEINQNTSNPVIPAGGIRISGTVSAKFSYLLGRVLELHQNEKILIFYEGDNIAWYLAQGLEALGIPHFIYANGIRPKLRNQYLDTFMQDDSEERVMLIDLRQGSHGLNITAASRIFFVNQVWHVGTEAQAIKRAHRIGQKKPVYVETLILKDSIEQRIFERRRQLTAEEQAKASVNPLDDSVVHSMLQSCDFYGGYEEMTDEHRYAPLSVQPLVFPELAASQARENAINSETNWSSATGKTSGNNAGQGDSAAEGGTEGSITRPVKKVKKTVGFA